MESPPLPQIKTCDFPNIPEESLYYFPVIVVPLSLRTYLGFYYCDKHHDQKQTNKQTNKTKNKKNLGRKGFSPSYTLCLTWREVRTGAQGRNLEAGTEAEALKECWLPTGLFSLHSDPNPVPPACGQHPTRQSVGPSHSQYPLRKWSTD